MNTDTSSIGSTAGSTEEAPLATVSTDATKQASNDPLLDRAEGYLQRIGKLRDGVLTLAGLAYIAGYAVWAINAWRANLGLLPALQVQYFIAGLVPCILIALVVPSNKLLSKTVETLSLKLSQNNICIKYFRVDNGGNKDKRYFILTIPLLVFTTTLTFFINSKITHDSLALEYYFIILSFIVIFNLMFIQITSTTNILVNDVALTDIVLNHPDSKRERSNSYWVTQACLSCVLLFLYITGIYQNLPQEFGGIRPRTAYLDLKRINLSSEAKAGILSDSEQSPPGEPSKDRTPVIGSKMVDVYFTSSDFLLCRPHGAALNTRVFQVPKDVIESVTWTGEGDLPTPVPTAIHALIKPTATPSPATKAQPSGKEK